MSEARAPLPFAWGVLYAHPNTDGSMKSCKNCYAWVSMENRCILHPKSTRITADWVCGYHIEGTPMPHWMDVPGIVPLEPKLSGLERVGEGTVCGTCRYFQRTSLDRGACHGVAKADRQPPAPVEIMGCCGRWEKATDG